MAEFDRLSGGSEWIDLAFVEQERTPEQIIEVGIQLHLAALFLSNTIQYLEKLGVQRSRTAIHDWVQKANLQPTGADTVNQIALDVDGFLTNEFGGTNFPLIHAVLQGPRIVPTPRFIVDYARNGHLSHDAARTLIRRSARIGAGSTVPTSRTCSTVSTSSRPPSDDADHPAPATTPESPRPLGIPRPPLRSSCPRCLRGRGTTETASSFLSPPGR